MEQPKAYELTMLHPSETVDMFLNCIRRKKIPTVAIAMIDSVTYRFFDISAMKILQDIEKPIQQYCVVLY